MDFSCMSLPLLVLLVIISEIIFIRFILKIFRKAPKTIIIGLGLIAFGAIAGVIGRVASRFNAVQVMKWTGLIAFIDSVGGIGLMLIGGYISTKDDSKKREEIRKICIAFVAMLIFILIIILIGIYEKSKGN